MKTKLHLFTLFVLNLALITSLDARAAAWHKQPRAIRAIAVVAHGLNNKPEAMNSIIRTLNTAGVDVLNLSLPILTDKNARTEIQGKRWHDEILIGHRDAWLRAQQLKVPLYFVGFSLGALLSAAELSAPPTHFKGAPSQFPEYYYDRQVLLAPAISVTHKALLIKVLGLLGDSYCVGSRAPEALRASDCTTMAAYNALFEALRRFEDNVGAQSFPKNKLNIPTLVIADSKDELVDSDGIQSLMKQQGLDQWKFESVQITESDFNKGYHHLIQTEESFSKEQWEKIQKALLRSLNL